MDDVFTIIGEGLAEADLAVAESTGVKLGFSHRGAAAITIFGSIVEIGAGSEKYEGHRVIEKGSLLLRIPVQTGISFPEAGKSAITKGDRFEYPFESGRYYWCTDDVSLVANGYIYVALVEFDKTLDTALGS